MILLVHNRYRTTGGEERAVSDLRWLIAEHLGEPVEVLQRAPAEGGVDVVGVNDPRPGTAHGVGHLLWLQPPAQQPRRRPRPAEP